MARLVVQYPGDAEVQIDGAGAGRTNRVIPLLPGEHEVRLAGEDTEPTSRRVTGDADEVVHVTFSPAQPPLDRFSPLYCAYNGFLLGQFLSLAFAQFGAREYAARRSRMLEFLREIDVELDIPEAPPGLDSETHVDLIETALPRVAERSRTLAEFLLLGALLTHYGILADSDPATARDTIDQFEFLRAKHKLPEIDPAPEAWRLVYADINGEAAALVYRYEKLESVFVFSTDADRITTIRVVRNPDKLAWLAAHREPPAES